ncbi:hypothetical protein IV203_009028 [Nitzschia inconspicua]|uniref:Uncharacterized protein n=1 Tax=Nitzschia inconspicua TaxID=303405 RepID=A0A9K3L1A3_9STRA|nr:hypothetical protein IV203_009028 [Nitzschia inconspicua]
MDEQDFGSRSKSPEVMNNKLREVAMLCHLFPGNQWQWSLDIATAPILERYPSVDCCVGAPAIDFPLHLPVTFAGISSEAFSDPVPHLWLKGKMGTTFGLPMGFRLIV